MLGMGGDTGTLNVERLRAADVSVAGTRQRCRSAVLRGATARAGTLRRATLLAGVSCAALVVLASGTVYAQVDGTWAGPGTEWTDGTNWSSNPQWRSDLGDHLERRRDRPDPMHRGGAGLFVRNLLRLQHHGDRQQLCIRAELHPQQRRRSVLRN